MTTIVALLVPIAGIIMGAMYLTKDKKGDNKLGERLLAVGVLFSLVATALWFFLVPTMITQSTTPAVAPVSIPATAAWNIDSSYAKLNKGMAKTDADAAIGRSSTNCSQVEQSSSTDRYASCTYGGPSDGGVIVINYVNDIVTTFEKATY